MNLRQILETNPVLKHSFPVSEIQIEAIDHNILKSINLRFGILFVSNYW